MAWPGVLKVAFVLTLLALFFITVGYLLPWWFVGPHYHLGLFYGLLCYPGDISAGNCTVFSYADIKTREADASTLMENVFFVTIQSITSVVEGLTILASLILIIGACGNVKSKCPYILAAIFQFFGSLIAGLTAGAFAYLFVVVAVSLQANIDAKVFPYSILSFGLGGFILFIAFICLAIATCTWRNMDDDDDDDMRPPYPMTEYNKNGYGNGAYTSDSRRNDYVVPSNAQKYGYDSRYEYNNSKNDYSKSRNDYSGSRNDYSGSRNDYSGSRNGSSKQDYPYRNDNMYRPYHNSGSRY